MSARNRYDTIIVGARAAGAATAMLLARRGLRVLVVDRASYGSDTLSTHALMRTAVLQLHRWGLLDQVRASGAPPIRRVSFHYPDESVAVEIAPSDGVDALYAPRRTVLDTILVNAAIEAGAEVRFGVAVDDLRKDPSGRVIGIVARDDHGHELELHSDVVIGADGIRSVVAQSAGAQALRLAQNSSATVYAYFRGVDAAGYEWAYAPGLAAGFIPTNDDLTCVFVAGPETRFRRDVFPDLSFGFHSMLRQVSPALADRVANGTRAERFRGFAGVTGYIRGCLGRGWALVGDAGYFRDPITTHGISDAFRDAELVARAIAAQAGMASYQELRDGVIGGFFEATDRIAGFDWTMTEIRAHLRDVSRAMRGELRLLEELSHSSSALASRRSTVSSP